MAFFLRRVVVELQLQVLQYGAWRLRYSLRSVLLLTTVAAAFFALASYNFRKNQREFAYNAELKGDLEAVIQGGTVSISNPGGRGILCQITRPSFSDDDLARVIDLASRGSMQTCELGHLFLGVTSVTNAGICQLAGCQKLIFIELPPIDLSDEAIKALAKCRRLESLVIDERGLRRELPMHSTEGASFDSPGWSEAQPWVHVAIQHASPERASFRASPQRSGFPSVAGPGIPHPNGVQFPGAPLWAAVGGTPEVLRRACHSRFRAFAPLGRGANARDGIAPRWGAGIATSDYPGRRCAGPGLSNLAPLGPCEIY